MLVMESPPGAETVIDGRRYLYFGGTAYLGLQGHPAVIGAACDAARRYGIGSATTRAWFGHTPPVLDVERLAARLFAADDAFYYASGFMSNHILCGALAETYDAVFVDERSHYSLLEAVRLSGRPVFPFRHRDPESLAALLRANLQAGARPLVASDGVFPVLGTIAPVDEYRAIASAYPGSLLLIDDAHAVGVLGEHGRGTYEYAGLLGAGGNAAPGPTDAGGTSADAPQLLFSGTLSKALGGYGGIIPGTRPFIDWLKSHSHYFDGASGPSVPAAAASAKALELVLAEPALRARLHENVRRLKTGLRRLGLPADDTPVPIVALVLGSGENMARIQRELAARGIMIAHAASYAGVGPGGALRLAVFATHTTEMIERLLDELRGIAG